MSQLGADRWVLENHPEKGFFVDVGCGDATLISNTFELEKNGWTGICIDAFPRNFDMRSNCVVESAVVFSEKDKEVEFVISDEDQDYSGILENLGTHKNIVLGRKNTVVTYTTTLLEDILYKYSAPSHIDYINLDIEGSEYEVLRTFPFERYSFGFLSVEHNGEEPKKTMIHDLLVSKGYDLYADVKWDSWYWKRRP